MDCAASLSHSSLVRALQGLQGLRLGFQGPDGEQRWLVLESDFRVDLRGARIVISCSGRLCLWADGAPAEAAVASVSVALVSQNASDHPGFPAFSLELLDLQLYQGRSELDLQVSKIVNSTVLPGQVALSCDARDVAYLMTPDGLSRERGHVITGGRLDVHEDRLDVLLHLEPKSSLNAQSGEFRIAERRLLREKARRRGSGAA